MEQKLMEHKLMEHELMEHELSAGAKRSSDIQEIPHILWNQEVHYHVRKTSPLSPLLRQTNSVHTLPTRLLKAHFDFSLILLLPVNKMCKVW
jgi:hypothetical protein